VPKPLEPKKDCLFSSGVTNIVTL